MVFFVNGGIDIEIGVVQDWLELLDIVGGDISQSHILMGVRIDSFVTRVPGNFSSRPANILHHDWNGVRRFPTRQPFICLKVHDLKNVGMGGQGLRGTGLPDH